MKTISLFIISLALCTVSLYSRVNPFEQTQTYINEKKILLDEIKKKNTPKIKKTVVKKEIVKPKIVKEVKVVKKEIIKPKIVKKEVIKKEREIIILKPVQFIVSDINSSKKIQKPREIKTYKYNLLSFVDIHITDDIMSIATKYKLKNYFILKDENKIVFDYIGKKRFYTKRETLSSHKDFKKIIIGAHPEDYYFRVVIQTQESVFKYNTTIDEGLVTIIKSTK